MIEFQGGHQLAPTRFPDGTSQVWKLPDEIMSAKEHRLTWWFEEERELVDLMSLRLLLANREIDLFIPYLPYARQDKPVANDATFNLRALKGALDAMNFRTVHAVDVHSHAAHEINHFRSLGVESLHRALIERMAPDYIVYPDLGARNRYKIEHPKRVIFYKKRDAQTGQITDFDISYRDSSVGYTTHTNRAEFVRDFQRFLIVDDICDGGATFINIANKLRETGRRIELYLFVTHGIFSKGREPLEAAGLKILTTNSLRKNTDGLEVPTPW